MNKQQLLKELKQEGFSELIIKAFEKIKREDFVPEHLKEYAYRNEPLPIALGSTISQPYTIAFMLNLLELDKLINDEINTNKEKFSKQELLIKQEKSQLSKSQDDITNKKDKKFDITNKKIKILEIGSGSGYVLALINEISKKSKIYGVEINADLVKKSKEIIKNKNIKIIKGDGSRGYKEKSPFDRILVSAAFDKIPENLFKQLKENGIMVTPVKNSIFQFKKINNKIQEKEFPGFVFVPVVEEENMKQRI